MIAEVLSARQAERPELAIGIAFSTISACAFSGGFLYRKHQQAKQYAGKPHDNQHSLPGVHLAEYRHHYQRTCLQIIYQRAADNIRETRANKRRRSHYPVGEWQTMLGKVIRKN